MNYKPIKSVDFIAVHCSASKPSANVDLAEIARWHKKRGFFLCGYYIGYHYVIKRDGTEEVGRPEDMPGAHVVGFNSRSLGICLVGGLNENGKAENNYTPQQFASLKALLTRLHAKYPNATIQGHRDFPNVHKDCPCFDVREWVAENLFEGTKHGSKEEPAQV